MPDNPKSTSRDFWWSTIKDIAYSFEKFLIEDFGIAQLDAKKLDEALEMYERGWWSFKEQVYGKHAKEERIDLHKIIAIYILSFLKAEPFRPSEPESDDDGKELAFLANEYFSLAIAQGLIFAETKSNKVFQMSENDKNWFIILLNNLKLKHWELNTPNISPDRKSDMADILSLAQIVYYIEKLCIQAPQPTPPRPTIARIP
jgi:hypothetical protein